MNHGEFLYTSHLSETEHGPLSSSERQVRILHAIVQPAPGFPFRRIANNLHSCAIGTQLVRHNDLWLAVALH